MEIKKPILAGELAAILAIWTVALVGCKNVAASTLESYFPQYFIELIKPGAPMFGISKRVELCVIVTLGASFFLFYCHDYLVKHINSAEKFLATKLNTPQIKEILTILLLEVAMIINVVTEKDVSIIFIFCLLMYVYPSNKF